MVRLAICSQLSFTIIIIILLATRCVASPRPKAKLPLALQNSLDQTSPSIKPETPINNANSRDLVPRSPHLSSSSDALAPRALTYHDINTTIHTVMHHATAIISNVNTELSDFFSATIAAVDHWTNYDPMSNFEATYREFRIQLMPQKGDTLTLAMTKSIMRTIQDLNRVVVYGSFYIVCYVYETAVGWGPYVAPIAVAVYFGPFNSWQNVLLGLGGGW